MSLALSLLEMVESALVDFCLDGYYKYFLCRHSKRHRRYG